MKKKNLFILLSILCYVLALCTPVFADSFFSDGPDKPNWGFEILIYGAVSLSGGHPGWLANIFWMASVILFFLKRRNYPLYASTVALLLSVDGFFWPFDHLYIGYYLWYAAMLLLMASTAIGYSERRKQTIESNQS